MYSLKTYFCLKITKNSYSFTPLTIFIFLLAPTNKEPITPLSSSNGHFPVCSKVVALLMTMNSTAQVKMQLHLLTSCVGQTYKGPDSSWFLQLRAIKFSKMWSKNDIFRLNKLVSSTFLPLIWINFIFVIFSLPERFPLVLWDVL